MEDADKIELAQLELRLTEKLWSARAEMIAMERSLRNSIESSRNLIFGTYALIIIGIFVNHLWR
jgi:hypothetical protein